MKTEAEVRELLALIVKLETLTRSRWYVAQRRILEEVLDDNSASAGKDGSDE